MFIVLAESHIWTRAFGPFPTVARASGYGFQHFGPNTFGCSVRWRILPVGQQ